MGAVQFNLFGPPTITILYVEDEPDDAMLVTLAFQRVGPEVNVAWVPNAEEAIAYLEGAGKYAGREDFPKPRALLLDLHLPGLSGCGFLEWLSRSEHAGLPVIVLSSGVDSRQHESALARGACLSLSKPCSFDELTIIARSVLEHCLMPLPIAEPIRAAAAAFHAPPPG